ncbi:N-acetylmuramoyl-L-alanine amidase [Cohaesibacter sp. CAU 1516]|uniref:peptidoglycan recognition protein family protein n=1 Tax=Cohaesibacter sp. CAU 1516 TaxID=2576038 RepID=UPI0010FECA9A|nr:N-acetylmuramoyl-L-alanine amidase [Cohaesibacter sp. CAU 1516]TLP48427.1 N-acetylmuramoyl-L-alanine amidase [Cohaesibacter sp. CAU 1516]
MLSATQTQCACSLNPSPNFGDRKNDGRIDMILLHYTGMEDDDQALNWLCNETSEVSSHYYIDRAGATQQLVAEEMRAWHAGEAFWKGEKDINSCSIGIEIANAGHEDFTEEQIKAVIALCQDLMARHDIPAYRVLGHSDVAPGRKIDPGAKFPWQKLADAGVGLMPEPETAQGGRTFQRGDEGQPIQALQTMLAVYGYRVDVTGVFDAATEAVVKAFQMHFLPERVDGVADAATITTLYKLNTLMPKL